ncbi:kinase-like domain-containing protein [Aspergillus karnatakaensis]|uniref:phosphotransferase family protein n=1 Tax=Aspergillus karnatakaensis TaxID=1810916 RepID=UPI003CCD0E6A
MPSRLEDIGQVPGLYFSIGPEQHAPEKAAVRGLSTRPQVHSTNLKEEIPPSLDLKMDFDNIKLAHFETLTKDWIGRCSQSSAGICALANKYRGRDDCMMRSMHSGSFNFSFRLNWDDGGEYWLIRFPLSGKSMILDEKVYREAVLMKYIARETTIPVPRVIAHGTAAENPTGLGPFIIMTWIEGKRMSDVLRLANGDPKVHVLNPVIDPEVLKGLYGQMAEVLLELWKLDLDSIGSLGEADDTGKTVINGRHLTQELNELVRTDGVVKCVPERTYQSSIDYIVSLLELQSTNLEQQMNGLYDSIDCREKYACRYLIKAIALNFIPRDNHGPFKLFSDDLWPGNVLVNDALEIVGVIDWEFCYAAPSQFVASIPWWLLLRRPDSLLNGSDPTEFLSSFLPKADIFLESMGTREQARGIKGESPRLSALMRQSIQDKSAWFMLACRMVGSVDLIYWDLLDEFVWGPRSSIAERVRSVTATPEIHRGREDFVRLKIRQLREYYQDLGETTDVDYEQENLVHPEVKTDEPKPPGDSGSNTFAEGLAAGLAFGLGFAIFINWYRR